MRSLHPISIFSFRALHCISYWTKLKIVKVEGCRQSLSKDITTKILNGYIQMRGCYIIWWEHRLHRASTGWPGGMSHWGIDARCAHARCWQLLCLCHMWVSCCSACRPLPSDCLGLFCCCGLTCEFLTIFHLSRWAEVSISAGNRAGEFSCPFQNRASMCHQ